LLTRTSKALHPWVLSFLSHHIFQVHVLAVWNSFEFHKHIPGSSQNLCLCSYNLCSPKNPLSFSWHLKCHFFREVLPDEQISPCSVVLCTSFSVNLGILLIPCLVAV
jgi:hypothetical protein